MGFMSELRRRRDDANLDVAEGNYSSRMQMATLARSERGRRRREWMDGVKRCFVAVFECAFILTLLGGEANSGNFLGEKRAL